MITILAGVALTAILLIGGLPALNAIFQGQANNDLGNITQMITQAKTWSATHNSTFSGMTTQIASGYNWFATSTGSGTSTVGVLSSGASVTVAATNVTSTNDGVAFTITGYKSNQCADLVQKVAPLVNSITVGGTAVKANGGMVNDATAGTQCAAGADNTTIVLSVKG